ncbi:sulfate ABC transporter substrate-binding protein [Microcoleus sp. FACHB-672]|uniref:sulfate ABC transporter substrate-binding protein n=1 Tax=Microcoleus sp. FACHB-672 TaxID=2692825 RepID=UPI0016898C36|nr:sulfate ABC transporter substrate-binding protein [Microcoleus sp. FACHB-672]MBD2039980.1 sulfate ABC transporter substrate-binding protein [Microcoleus sp. FACHB-672]
MEIQNSKFKIQKALQTIKQSCRRSITRWSNKRSVWGFVSLFLLGASLSVAVAACSGSNATSAPQKDIKLSLVSYSVTQAAYEQIVPKFVEKWQKEHNQNVTIEQSYGGSGSQSNAVVDGSKEADIVHLSLALDTQKIQQAGLIEPGWERKSPRSGIVTRSVVAIVTRPDNPKGINSWEDLAQEGLSIITANPKTSGIAIWNFLALWGSVTQKGGDETQALEFTTNVYKNVPVLANNARQASELFFKQGKGDVLLNYEDEVIYAEQNGQKLPYVVPDINISIDNPVALVDKNVDKHGTREVAQAFIDYLYTSEAQQEFAKLGYRPVNPSVVAEVAQNYPQLETLFTVQDLGGWDDVQNKFFAEGAIFDQIQVAGKI